MMIPIRCFSCGKPIGHLWEKYQNEVKAGKEAGKVMDSLGLERYCCRSVFLTHAQLVQRVGQFRK